MSSAGTPKKSTTQTERRTMSWNTNSPARFHENWVFGEAPFDDPGRGEEKRPGDEECDDPHQCADRRYDRGEGANGEQDGRRKLDHAQKDRLRPGFPNTAEPENKGAVRDAQGDPLRRLRGEFLDAERNGDQRHHQRRMARGQYEPVPLSAMLNSIGMASFGWGLDRSCVLAWRRAFAGGLRSRSIWRRVARALGRPARRLWIGRHRPRGPT